MKQAIDHNGIVYRSFNAMCAAHGQIPQRVRYRLKHGMPLREALAAKIVKDHLGNEYGSDVEMCRHYNVRKEVYWRRISDGWTVERALTTPVQPAVKYQPEIITDHEGNVFSTATAMCSAYGIDLSTFIRRRYKLGWTVKDALTKPLRKYIQAPAQDPVRDRTASESLKRRMDAIAEWDEDTRMLLEELKQDNGSWHEV